MSDVKTEEILRSREIRSASGEAYDAWLLESPAYGRLYDATCIESPQGYNQVLTLEIRQQLSKAPALLSQETVHLYMLE